MQEIVDIFSSYHDAMVTAMSTPCPDSFMVWKRDVDANGDIIFKAGKNWIRLEEKILK
jgi:hypothetical protein